MSNTKNTKNTNINQSLKTYLDDYLSNLSYNTNNYQNELEIRFGINDRNRITRIKFDNVINKLYSLGFQMVHDNGTYHLNINNDYVDFKTQRTKKSMFKWRSRSQLFSKWEAL